MGMWEASLRRCLWLAQRSVISLFAFPSMVRGSDGRGHKVEPLRLAQGRPGRNLTHSRPLWSAEKSNYCWAGSAPNPNHSCYFLSANNVPEAMLTFLHSVSLNPHRSVRKVQLLFLLHRLGNSETCMGAFPGHTVGQWSLTQPLPSQSLCYAATSDPHSAPLHRQNFASQIPDLQGALCLGVLGHPNLLEPLSKPLSWTPPIPTTQGVCSSLHHSGQNSQLGDSTGVSGRVSQNLVSSGHKHGFS